MDDITLNLIVLLVLGVIGGLAFLFFRSRASKRSADQVAGAQKRGWQVEEFAEDNRAGRRFHGEQDGVTWTAEAALTTTRAADYTGVEFNQTPETVWRTSAVTLPQGLLLLGTRSGSTDAGVQALGGLAGGLIQKALELMLGADSALAAGLKEHPVLGMLNNRFMVWAHSAEVAQRLNSPVVRSALAAWPSEYQLRAKLSPAGLEITLPGQRLQDPAALEKLVRLGVRLASSLRA